LRPRKTFTARLLKASDIVPTLCVRVPTFYRDILQGHVDSCGLMWINAELYFKNVRFSYKNPLYFVRFYKDIASLHSRFRSGSYVTQVTFAHILRFFEAVHH